MASTAPQGELAESLNRSAAVSSQVVLQRALDQSPRVAQLKLVAHGVVQRVGKEGEEGGGGSDTDSLTRRLALAATGAAVIGGAVAAKKPATLLSLLWKGKSAIKPETFSMLQENTRPAGKIETALRLVIGGSLVGTGLMPEKGQLPFGKVGWNTSMKFGELSPEQIMAATSGAALMLSPFLARQLPPGMISALIRNRMGWPGMKPDTGLKSMRRQGAAGAILNMILGGGLMLDALKPDQFEGEGNVGERPYRLSYERTSSETDWKSLTTAGLGSIFTLAPLMAMQTPQGAMTKKMYKMLGMANPAYKGGVSSLASLSPMLAMLTKMEGLGLLQSSYAPDRFKGELSSGEETLASAKYQKKPQETGDDDLYRAIAMAVGSAAGFRLLTAKHLPTTLEAVTRATLGVNKSTRGGSAAAAPVTAMQRLTALGLLTPGALMLANLAGERSFEGEVMGTPIEGEARSSGTEMNLQRTMALLAGSGLLAASHLAPLKGMGIIPLLVRQAMGASTKVPGGGMKALGALGGMERTLFSVVGTGLLATAMLPDELTMSGRVGEHRGSLDVTGGPEEGSTGATSVLGTTMVLSSILAGNKAIGGFSRGMHQALELPIKHVTSGSKALELSPAMRIALATMGGALNVQGLWPDVKVGGEEASTTPTDPESVVEQILKPPEKTE
jgi:hypothetical protein